MKDIKIGICGYGGQGVILSAVIIGTTVVTEQGRYAVQTQSYGSEARGGQCQSELIISDRPINSPIAAEKDILIALSQPSLDRYLPSLRKDGILIIDPMTVLYPPEDRNVIEVPATETAIRVGNRIVANMVLVGFLQSTLGLFSEDGLLKVVLDHVPAKYTTLNREAVLEGISFGQHHGGITL